MGVIFFAQITTIRIEHLSIRWGVRWDNRWTYIGTHVGRNIFRPYNDHNPKFAQYHTHGWALLRFRGKQHWDNGA